MRVRFAKEGIRSEGQDQSIALKNTGKATSINGAKTSQKHAFFMQFYLVLWKFEASILENFSVGAVERWKGNRDYEYKRIICELLNNHWLAGVDRYNDHTNRTHSKPSQSMKSSPRVGTVVNVTPKSPSTQPSQNPSGKVDWINRSYAFAFDSVDWSANKKLSQVRGFECKDARFWQVESAVLSIAIE